MTNRPSDTRLDSSPDTLEQELGRALAARLACAAQQPQLTAAVRAQVNRLEEARCWVREHHPSPGFAGLADAPALMLLGGLLAGGLLGFSAALPLASVLPARLTPELQALGGATAVLTALGALLGAAGAQWRRVLALFAQ